MVIVKVMGGLGNQMFQYASARGLASASGTELKLDLSWFREADERFTPRRYALDLMNIRAEIARPEEVDRLVRRDAGFIQRTLRSYCPPLARRSHFEERHSRFDPSFLSLTGDVYLVGYWQCVRYFAGIRETIREEFRFRQQPDEWNRGMARTIVRTESVSIHVRRGDYVTDSRNHGFLGLCSPEYYQDAMETMARKVPAARFFVFSDDLQWTKDQLRPPCEATFVDGNDEARCHEDLRLMSLCKHHIIANSTFSWWGAWLGENPDRIVIAPEPWFVDQSDLPDIVPETWIRLPARHPRGDRRDSIPDLGASSEARRS